MILDFYKKIFSLNTFFFLSGFGLFFYVIYRLDEIDQVKIITLLTYSLIMFLFLFREKLSMFSVWGLKAELRSEIDQAKTIINNLRMLGKLLIQPSAFTIARLGRNSTVFSHREMFEFRTNAKNVMNSLGIPDKETDETLLVIHQFILFDLLQNAKKSVNEILNHKLEEHRKNHRDQFKESITSNMRQAYDRSSQEEEKLIVSLQGFKNLSGIDLIFDSYDRLIKEINNNPLLSPEEKQSVGNDIAL